MPQGTWLGPYAFLILINDLNTIMPTFQFTDDVTMTEITDQSGITHLQLATDQIVDWSHLNHMNINGKKTEEMLFGSVLKDPPLPPPIVLGSDITDRVTSCKFL